jgi:methyltransferase family protein
MINLKLKPPKGHRVVEIPDVNRNDFATFLAENGYKVGVEIGVNKGEYGILLCKAGLKVYGVDCWENYDGYKRVGTYHSNKEEAVEALKDYDYTIIHKYSIDAVKDFENESLDFIYIDGNHTLPHIVADIFAWEPKIRKGGIISGHDYANILGSQERNNPKVYDGCHVRAGVNAACEIMKVDKLYVLGQRWSKNRDKWRTYFWIKK